MRRLRGVFGMRGPLSGESTAFFGVGSRVDKVLGGVLGQSATNCVALVGPARSGRSSLLRRIAHPPDLARNGAPGALSVEVGMRAFRHRPEDALSEMVGQLAVAMDGAGLPTSASLGAASLRTAVTTVLGSFGGRLLFVLDDFECVASELRKADQMEMRQAVYKQDRVAYVLGSRIPLSHCTEEFGDALSEIAPLFSTHYIEPLTVKEVERTIVSACPTVSAEEAARIAHYVCSLVGGFPEWVQRALAVIPEVVEAEGGAIGDLDGLRSDVIESVVLDLEDDLRRSFSRLPTSAKRLILGLSESPVAFAPSTAGHNELLASGWIAKVKHGEPVRIAGEVLGTWLSRRGGDELHQRPSEPMGRYERLVSAVDVLNDRHRHAMGKGGPKLMRPDVFTIPRHMPHLLRNVRNRGELDSFCHALALLLYDGTGGGTSGMGAKPTLPQWCYDDSRSVVRHVMDLRHATAHLHHADVDDGSKRQDALSRVYACYLDVPSPANERDFRMLADNIFEAAIKFIEKITGYVPFAASLSPDAVFGPRPG